VVCRTIDNGLKQRRHFKVAVVDRHRPDVDSHVQCQVQHLMQREQKHINMVRYALHKTIDGVKSMTGIWCRHFPCMMRLVYCSIDESVMKSTMNPIDEEVSEKDERTHRQYNP